jgi:hypothetical protein
MSTTASNIVAASATNFGSVDPKLASMSFVELDSTITEGLTSAKSKLVNLEPYLLEMRERLSAQGRRTDLLDTPKGLTWQKWVEQKKNLLGSLSTVKRLLRGDRKKKRTEKTPELTHFESKLLGTAICGHELIEAVQRNGNIDAAIEQYRKNAPSLERIEELIQHPVKQAPETLCQAAANLVREIEAHYSRPNAPPITNEVRNAVDKLKAELSLAQGEEQVKQRAKRWYKVGSDSRSLGIGSKNDRRKADQCMN